MQKKKKKRKYKKDALHPNLNHQHNLNKSGTNTPRHHCTNTNGNTRYDHVLAFPWTLAFPKINVEQHVSDR